MRTTMKCGVSAKEHITLLAFPLLHLNLLSHPPSSPIRPFTLLLCIVLVLARRLVNLRQTLPRQLALPEVSRRSNYVPTSDRCAMDNTAGATAEDLTGTTLPATARPTGY